jgi:hypothetical protein
MGIVEGICYYFLQVSILLDTHELLASAIGFEVRRLQNWMLLLRPARYAGIDPAELRRSVMLAPSVEQDCVHENDWMAEVIAISRVKWL